MSQMTFWHSQNERELKIAARTSASISKASVQNFNENAIKTKYFAKNMTWRANCGKKYGSVRVTREREPKACH
jgi:hypothetical protein